MQTDYAREYGRLYNEHWWWRAREEFVVDAIERHQPRADGRVLDIGCGDGLFFPVLQRWGTVEGVEADASLVSRQDRKEGQIHVTPFDDSFRPRTKYSLIVMLDVLEHLPDARAALRHAVSLLEPSGLLVLTVPAFRLLWTQHDEMNRHFTRYTEATFRPLARHCGLDLDECRYFYHWLFPLKMAVRAREWYCPGEPKPPRVPDARLNQLLTGIARMEQRICRHWNLPFGSSLLAVGRPCRRAKPVVRLSRPTPATAIATGTMAFPRRGLPGLPPVESAPTIPSTVCNP